MFVEIDGLGRWFAKYHSSVFLINKNIISVNFQNFCCPFSRIKCLTADTTLFH